MGIRSKAKSVASSVASKVGGAVSSVAGAVGGAAKSVAGTVGSVVSKATGGGKTSPSGTTSSSSSSSSSKSSGGRSSSAPAGTPIGSAAGGGVLRSDGQGGTYVDSSTTPSQAIKELSRSSSMGKLGASGKISTSASVGNPIQTLSSGKVLTDTGKVITRQEANKLMGARGSLQQQAFQSKIQSPMSSPYPAAGEVVGSAPGGNLVSDGKGGTRVVYKSREQRKQEAFQKSYEQSIQEQTGQTPSKIRERESKVKTYADSQFSYYQKLVDEGKISPEEASAKYSKSVSAYETGLLQSDLSGAGLAGMSLVSGGKAFSVVPTKEQEAKALAAGEGAAGQVKFTGRDALGLGQSLIRLPGDFAVGTGKAIKQGAKDVSFFAQESATIIKSPMSYEGGKGTQIKKTFTSLKSVQATGGFLAGVGEEIVKVPKAAFNIGAYAGDFGYRTFTGKRNVIKNEATGFDSSRPIYKDTNVRSAVVTVGTGFGIGAAFRGVGYASKVAFGVKGAKIVSGLGYGVGAVAGTSYAYQLRSQIMSAEGPEAKGRVFGKATGETALFVGGMSAGSKAAGKVISGFTPTVYTNVVPVDAKVYKPVSVTGLPKQRNIFTNAQGKSVVLDSGLPVRYVADVGVAGRQSRLSTPLREALGLKPKYSGGTARQNPKAYQKALKSLQKQGYTKYQAKEVLRLRRPQYQRTFFEGEMTISQIENQPLQRALTGKQTTRYLPGQKGGINFFVRQSIVKTITERGVAVGEQGVKFQAVEENLAKPLGKQTETFLGLGKAKNLAEGELGFFEGEIKNLGLDVYQTGQFEAFGTSTVARRVNPLQRNLRASKGLAFVQKGDPLVTITDLSVQQSRGFKGGGKKSSPEFFKKLYAVEQISVSIPSTRLPSVRKPSTVGKPLKSMGAGQGDGRLPTGLSQGLSDSSNILRSGRSVSDRIINRASSVFVGGSVGGIVQSRISSDRISSAFVSGFQSRSKQISATKKGTEEDENVLSQLNVPLGKLPTFDLAIKSINPKATFTKIQEPVKTFLSSQPVLDTRARSRSDILPTISFITAQRTQQVVRQAQVSNQGIRQQQRVFQAQAQVQLQQFRYPTQFKGPTPFFFTPYIRPYRFVPPAARPEFGRGFGGRGRTSSPINRGYRYTPSLTSVLLGIGGRNIPQQTNFSGFEVRPAFIIPQRGKRK